MGKRGRELSPVKRRPSTRQSEMKRKKKEETKRQRLDLGDEGGFVPGPNDILVDDQCNKVRVKVEAEGDEDSGATVKQEVVDSVGRVLEDVVTESVNTGGGLPEVIVKEEDQVPVVFVNEEVIIENDDQDQEDILENVTLEKNRSSREDELEMLLKQRNIENRALSEMIERLETQLAEARIDSSKPNNVLLDKDLEMANLQKPLGSPFSSAGEAEIAFQKKEAELRTILQEKDSAIANLNARLTEGKSLSGLSKEVVQAWQMIPDKLENREDYVSCCQAFKKVDELLEQQKVNLFFDEVLKVLIQQELTAEGYIDWEENWSLLLSCRRICNSWKRSVDNLLENHPSQLALPKDVLLHYDNDYYRPFPATLDFRQNKEWIQIYTKSFKKQQELFPAYNPIPTRHLKLSVNPSFTSLTRNIDSEQFRQNISSYLEAFGTQVWYLTVSLYPTDFENLMWAVRCISQWLELLPNLKSVAFEGGRLFEQQLGEQMRANPDGFLFPHLKNLVTIQFDNYSPLICKMLETNKQVEKLRLIAFLDSVHVSRILEMDLANLSELNIAICRKEHLVKLGTVRWKLRCINLHFRRHFEESYFSLQSILNVLTEFKDTLESLSLELPDCEMSGMLGDTFLTLCHLKYLRIACYQKENRVQLENLLKTIRGVETMEIKMVETETEENWLSYYWSSNWNPHSTSDK